ncbi:ribose-5-phosphate isomerase A [Streptomyces sp. NPDC091267]|uniref:ribose-5-phosphate isomerase A n=1 Tax=unclassified Streptomyces TaxID=2593676 RepID=UPI00344125B2
MSGPHRSSDGKAVAARAGAALVTPGARLALGTGSTVEAALPALAAVPGLVATPTSEVIAARAAAAGITLVPVQSSYDFYLDGADQVSPEGHAVKGSWGAHVREKTLALLAGRRILVCDRSKLVEKITGPVPVAVLPYFASLYGADADSQIDDNGLVVVRLGAGEVIDSPAEWDAEMCRRPGVVMTGVFPAGFVERIITGHPDGSVSLVADGSDPA